MKVRLQALICLPLLLILIIFIAYHLAYWQRIYPGITVNRLAIGNLTSNEALLLINKQLNLDKNKEIILQSGEQKWKIPLKEINFEYQPQITVQKAYQYGRTGHFFTDLADKKNSGFYGKDFSYDFSYQTSLLESQIATIAAQIASPNIEPSIEVKNNQVVVDPGKPGKEVDQNKLLAQINQELAKAGLLSVEIPFQTPSGEVTEEQLSATKTRAEAFLGKKLTILVDNNRYSLVGKDLIGYLTFNNGFDQGKISDWVESLAQDINQLPQNPAFQFENGRVTVFRPSQDGKTLIKDKAIDLLKEALASLEKGKEETEITFPIASNPPIVTTDQVNSLGIKELIGQGVSSFRGSIPSRVHNLTLAASKLNGLLIPPGESFSFNKNIGDISTSTGFQPAYIIQEGRTVLGDGGGVCQVSTTLFRAALNTGLPVLERHAHAYRVGYYEQESEVGQDATVFSPSTDLIIKNDTQNNILIQTKIDQKLSRLTFLLYGASDGRKVTLSKSKIWDQTPPPPDLYQDDPSLPVGTTKQVDWKAWGAKVSFTWKVERGNEILEDRTFYSVYRPWQAIYLRGSKTN